MKKAKWLVDQERRKYLLVEKEKEVNARIYANICYI